jgi:prevent-host-death family protein
MPGETFNVHAAKTHLSRLLERAEAGDDIVIARDGRPIVRLVPYTSTHPVRTFGILKGRIRVLDAFDEADPEIEREFEESIARALEP